MPNAAQARLVRDTMTAQMIEKDVEIMGLQKKLTESLSANEKLTWDVTGVWQNVQHRSGQEQQLRDQQLHLMQEYKQHISDLWADISTLEKKLSKEKAHGKLAQHQKEETNKVSESRWEVIKTLQEENDESKSISAREVSQTNASLAEALAEKVWVRTIHKQFKALSKVREQQQLQEQISVLKEQISVLNVDHGMAVVQAKSAAEMLQLESCNLHDCQGAL
jgi:hypothetical protein